MEPLRLLLVSGSTRPGSSNTRVLRLLHEREWSGVSTDLYDGLIDVPAFVPGAEPGPWAVRDLHARLDAADVVLFSTPEYAGGLPGALKNLLDWTVGGGWLHEKPVAWLDVAGPGRGAGARAQLRTVLGYVGARILEAACVHVTLAADTGDADAVAAQDAQLATAVTAIAARHHEPRRGGVTTRTDQSGSGGWPTRLRPGALRWARASHRYDETIAFYRDLVGLPVVGEFTASFGEDGTIFGLPDTTVQMEVVRAHPGASSVGGFDQLVLYLDDAEALATAAAPLLAAGLAPDPAQHAYWAANGAVTFRDPDGRGLVLAPWVYGRAPEPVDVQPPGA